MDDATATALGGCLEIRIRDLERPFFVGANATEKGRRQRLRINVWMYVEEDRAHDSDDLADTVSYSDVVRGIDALALSDRHVELVETVAERVAALALADPRVKRAVVAVEKPDVYAHVGAVGVRIERWRGRDAGRGAA